MYLLTKIECIVSDILMGHHILTILVLTICKVTQGQYYFKNSEDKEVCLQANFVDISPLRVVSMTQMSWQSAHACCKMKGRLLHTIEKSMESAQYPLQQVLPDKLGVEAEDLQFWIGLSFHNERFQWSFGSVLPPSHEKVFQDMYLWVDGHPELSPTTRCVAISPYKGMLEMRTASCNMKLHFICQSVPRVGGEPLSGLDMMAVGTVEFMKIPGFDNLKFGKVFTRWPVANAICQSRNWVLIDGVHERYGDKLAKVILKSSSKYMFHQDSRTFHTSGNDFCESKKWQWACGERLVGIIPWIQNITTRPKGTSKDNENCLQYLIGQPTSSAVLNSTFFVDNVDCNEFGYTICDTAPSCSVDDQYRCLHKDPHFIDIEGDLKVEKEICKRSEFREIKVMNGINETSYWVSLSKFTWQGSNTCCKSRGWISVAPKTTDELESLTNGIFDVISNHCKNEKMCDGFWTSATTQGYLPHSPLRFSNGKLLTRSLYNIIRADGFSYPSCGRINFMDLHKSHAKYVHADCLEKNLIVCEEEKQEKHNIIERKVLDEFDDGVDEFEESVFKKFLATPTEEDLERQRRNHSRDACRIADIHSKYSENCPDSADIVGPEFIPVNPKNESVNTKIDASFQNKKILLEQLIKNAFYLTNETGDLLGYAFQFLNTSVNLFSKLCPIVPHSFLLNSYRLFRMLHISLHPKRKPEIITKVNFDWAMKLLGFCEDYMKPVNIKLDNCGDVVVGETSCTNFICTDAKYEFNLHKTDVLLDIIWKVFEAIHAACFPAFNQNPRLHHKYAMVITDLWESEGIRLRWSHLFANKQFWKRLLGPHFEEHIINLERCNTATIANSYFHVRLPRVSVPYSVRMTGFSYEKLDS